VRAQNTAIVQQRLVPAIANIGGYCTNGYATGLLVIGKNSPRTGAGRARTRVRSCPQFLSLDELPTHPFDRLKPPQEVIPILIAPLLLVTDTGTGIARLVLLLNSLMDCTVIAILLHSANNLPALLSAVRTIRIVHLHRDVGQQRP
jgi:hypothetical protein